MGYEIQGAGCSVQGAECRVQGEIVMLQVYIELQESMTAPSPRSTPNIATHWGSQVRVRVGVRVRVHHLNLQLGLVLELGLGLGFTIWACGLWTLRSTRGGAGGGKPGTVPCGSCPTGWTLRL